jgi:phosphatidylinositol-3-phosphatase
VKIGCWLRPAVAWLRLSVPLVLVSGLGLAPAAQAGVTAAAATSLCGSMDGTHPATVDHVMFIVFENKSYGAIVGSKSAPYMNRTLIPDCGVASNYHNYSHPSTPNYLALTSGTAQGKAASADCQPSGCPQTQASIFSQLGNAGQTWREYAEAMPGNCDKKNYDNTSYVNANGSVGEEYYVRHAPPPYYTSAPVPGECSTWDIPLGTSSSGAFLSALSPDADGLPSFSFVTPGGCDDMHDCSTIVGDDWLKEWIPLIQQSLAYQSGQLVVFITWDEGTGADKVDGESCWDTAHADSSAYPSCHVPAIVMSPYTTPGTVSDAYFNHLSTLATAEDLLGLPRLPTTQGYTGLESAFGL